jgi:hypothetical protein
MRLRLAAIALLVVTTTPLVANGVPTSPQNDGKETVMSSPKGQTTKTQGNAPVNGPKIYAKIGNIQWRGFSKEELASIKAPMLIIQGDRDFVRLEHSVETFKLIPPEPERVVPMIKRFLEKTGKELPLATANVGYHPGETRQDEGSGSRPDAASNIEIGTPHSTSPRQPLPQSLCKCAAGVCRSAWRSVT